MSERRALSSGVLLADRYELQDLVSDRLGAVTWRALDLLLNRNVGVEMIPSTDPRAPHFLEAARQSTAITDARFLRVLDLLENQHGHHAVVREWAKAFGLDQLLAQSSLPSHRAAQVVAEVAEALAHAHERGLYHRRLAPHHILVKESGAVRIVGLGLASALDEPDHTDSAADRHAHELTDVESLGKLLYACLVSRWPGGEVDHLPPAPREHGHVLRPRQVRAGVSRDVDDICDRILSDHLGHHAPTRLTSAEDVARALQLVGNDVRDRGGPATATLDPQRASPDLLRSDPVREPSGPVPGLTATRRPKASEPPPPTRIARAQALAVDAARDDRRFVIAGVGGALVLVAVIAVLAFRAAGVDVNPFFDAAPRTLPISTVDDFDPDGDGEENAGAVPQAIDGDPDTGWRTTTYFNRPTMGGLKDGVGLILDLGQKRRVSQVVLTLAGSPTSVRIYGSENATVPPDAVGDLDRLGAAKRAGEHVRISLNDDAETRYLVVWLTSLPEVANSRYRGEVREVVVRGNA